MTKEDQIPHVGVYTPNLQGFYFSELVSQLCQLSHLKDYRISIIRTGKAGVYASKLHIDKLDYIVILRNAIHPELAEHLISLGKPVVSIGYDYFPLRIPFIGVDNYQGTELAFDYLLNKGLRNIAFIGDISQFDCRKRYEAYCELHEKHGMEINEDNIYSITSSAFLGSKEVANQFLNRTQTNTGIIFARTFDSVGFNQYLLSKNPEAHVSTPRISFGSNSLVPAAQSKMGLIDLNLHIVAYRALSTLEDIAKGKEVKSEELVECKLIDEDNTHYHESDAYLATAVELPELSNANYVKSVFCTVQDWPKTIAKTNFDEIMLLQFLFGKFLEKAYFGRVAKITSGKELIKIDKIIFSESITAFENTDRSSLVAIESFPPEIDPDSNADSNTQPYISLLLPIYLGDKFWGILSTEAFDYRSTQLSSLTALAAYLENTVDHYIKHRLESNASKGNSIDAQQASSQRFKITWNKNRNETLWDDDALNYLGFSSELEKGIYKHMEIFDRLDGESEELLSSVFQNNEFDIEVKIRHKNKSYVPFRLSSKGIEENSDTRIFFLNPFM